MSETKELIARIKAGITDGWSGDAVCLDGYIAIKAAEALESQAQAIEELVTALSEGAQINTPQLMDWVAERLVLVHGENPNVDYVLALKTRAKKIAGILAKHTGKRIT